MIFGEVAAWAVIATMAVILGTQLIGLSGTRLVVTIQAATPFVFALSIAIIVVAAVTGRWLLLAAATLVALGIAALGWSVIRSPKQRARPAASPTVRVFHGNLLYNNSRTAELATVVARLDADLLAFTEYTPAHAAGLRASPLAAGFRYRIENPEPRAGGSALWSRYPLTSIAAPPALYKSTAASVEALGGFDIAVVHPPNPLPNLPEWSDELDGLARLYVGRERPTIVVGDLNATPWHPPFRRTLAAGWRDAHQLTGRGLSLSWPTDKWWMPAMLRLDHTLVDETFIVDGVVDVDLPGSDHDGFVVTLSIDPALRAERARRSRSPQAATDGSSTGASPHPKP